MQQIYEEFTDFITSRPTLEAIAEYRLSDAAEGYINGLLDANQSRLDAQQTAELEKYALLEHLMRIVKFKAIEKRQQTSS